MSEPLAVDTSVAVPLLVQAHAEHRAVSGWAHGRVLALSGHAALETYSVLTRLPGDLRAAPIDVARVMRDRFEPPYLLDLESTGRLPDVLGELGITGGAVYDALVGEAARTDDRILLTRDRRAIPTYALLGVTHRFVGA